MMGFVFTDLRQLKLTFLLLCSEQQRWEVLPVNKNRHSQKTFIQRPALLWKAAGLAALISSLMAAVIFFLLVEVLQEYSAGVFVFLPLAMGYLSTWLYSRQASEMSFWEGQLVSLTALAMSCGGLLLFAFEGFICILMVAPLAAVVAFLGSGLAYGLHIRKRVNKHLHLFLAGLILTLPLLSGYASKNSTAYRTEVRTRLTLQASPEQVWQVLTHNLAVPTPEPKLFQTGIAYPLSSHWQGQGKGSRLVWRFSTGDVHKQITHWQPKQLLAYQVTQSPEMMRELSPYDIHPHHLRGYIEATQGHFRLVALGPQETLLEGYTEYKSRIWPAFYWIPQASYLHKQVQQLVLKAIASKVSQLQQEQAAQAAAHKVPPKPPATSSAG